MQQKIIKVALILLGAGVLAFQQFTQNNNGNEPTAEISAQQTGKADYRQAIERIRNSASNPDAKFWTDIQGEVIKLLRDDREGSQHQRFLIRVAPDITLLVAHNIDLAPRVPVREGDRVKIYGEYAWNNRGGVMHWTHHNPRGRREGGWIELDGKRYE